MPVDVPEVRLPKRSQMRGEIGLAPEPELIRLPCVLARAQLQVPLL